MPFKPAHFMNPTTASSTHSLPLLRDIEPRPISLVKSNQRYGRHGEPYTPATRNLISTDGITRDLNNIPPSTPPSLYETGSGSLYTSGLATRVEDDEITSLERIKKRNSALMKLEGAESPLRGSFEGSSSPLPRLHTAADVRVDALTTPGSRRSLQIDPRQTGGSSPWIQPYTPTGFYLQSYTGGSANILPVSGDDKRPLLSRRLSSMSLRGRVQGDIWEQASEDKENIDGTQSISGLKKKGAITRGLRRGIDKIMGNSRQDKATSSPIDHVAKASVRAQGLSSRPHSVYGSSPLGRSITDLSDTRSLYTPSTRYECLPAPGVSNEYIEYIQSNLHGHLTTPASTVSLRPSSRSQFTPSPLFGGFPTRSPSLSPGSKLNIGSSPPTLSVVQPIEVLAQTSVPPSAKLSLIKSQISHSPRSEKLTEEMSLTVQAPALMATKLDLIPPETVFAQEPILVSTCLTLMSPKRIFSQEPIHTLTELTIMAPMTIYSQVPIPADSPMFFFALSIIFPLLLATTQALAFALHRVGEDMCEELVYEMIKGWIVGAASGIVLHACGRGVTRLYGDVLFMLAWIVGSIIWMVKGIMRKIVEGFSAGSGA